MSYHFDVPAEFSVSASSAGSVSVLMINEGIAGKSAYQSAVDVGFVGTEAEWIASFAGSANDKTFVYQKTVAGAVWTVPHNLGKYPAVMVVDALGNLLAADIAYIDINTVQITHGIALIGSVYCN